MLACCGAWSSERVRSAFSLITSSSTCAFASRSRSTGSSKVPFARASSSRASSSRWKPTCWPTVEMPRSKPRVPMATCQPLPSPPTTRSASVRAPVKNTSLNSEVPVSWLIGRMSTPSWSIGTSR